jgi:hypothetical protein
MDVEKERITANQQINFDPDNIPKTILKEWHINSSFQLLSNTAPGNTLHNESMPHGKLAGEKLELNPQLMTKWQRAISGNVASRRRLGDIQPQLSLCVHVETGFEVNGKQFTSQSQHTGNSQVEVRLGRDQRFGHIKTIFLSPQTPCKKTWVIVQLLKEVAQPEDPYQNYPNLNCRLIKVDHEVVMVIPREDVIGHAAMLKHKSGTFGLSTETYTAVGLGTAVHHSYLSGLNYN